jgi:uncharacterized protein involved in exopolysaccharide biosynthesis
MINTDYIEVSRYSDKSVVKKGRWQRYLLLGLATNIAFWGSAFLYLKLTPPTYTSSSAVNLPGTWSNANVTLPDIGQANYENVSPYASLATQDPREIYKFLAESEPVMKAAAAQLNMSLEEFGEPRLKVIVNTSLMTVDFKGASPEEARNKSLAFYKAFGARLNELRVQEANQRQIGYQDALTASQKKLETVQNRLSNYKASSGLSSDNQISDLTTNIEQLRRQRAEIVAQQQQSSTRLKELSTNLKVSAGQATDAFVIQTDQIFQQNLKDYSEASATLDILNGKFLPNYPTVIRERGKRDAAEKALIARSQLLLGRPISLETLKQLNLNNNNSNTAKEALFQELITVEAEQKGLTAQAEAIEEQIAQLESRLRTLTQKGATLDSLKRDTQVAEAVFSSNLAKLDITKSTSSSSYPLIQIVTEPNLPKNPSSPKEKLVLLGAASGSLFVSLGLLLLWWRERKNSIADMTVKR